MAGAQPLLVSCSQALSQKCRPNPHPSTQSICLLSMRIGLEEARYRTTSCSPLHLTAAACGAWDTRGVVECCPSSGASEPLVFVACTRIDPNFSGCTAIAISVSHQCKRSEGLATSVQALSRPAKHVRALLLCANLDLPEQAVTQ